MAENNKLRELEKRVNVFNERKDNLKLTRATRATPSELLGQLGSEGRKLKKYDSISREEEPIGYGQVRTIIQQTYELFPNEKTVIESLDVAMGKKFLKYDTVLQLISYVSDLIKQEKQAS